MNIFNIEKAYKLKEERGWDRLYWCIDFHGTIFEGTYNKHQVLTINLDAIEVLQQLCERDILIAYSSTPLTKIEAICRFLFTEYQIYFTYINENPEYVGTTNYADFTRKFYYNILLDDKAGFELKTDWLLVKNELIRIGEW